MRGRASLRTLAGAFGVALGLAITGEAHNVGFAPVRCAYAQDEWNKDQGDKPGEEGPPASGDKPTGDKPTGDKPKADDKADLGVDPDKPEAKKNNDDAPKDETPKNLLVELKIGPAFILAAKAAGTRGATEFGLQINLGYALSHDLATKGDTLYLTLSPNLLVGSDLALIVPLGVQYDLPLKMVPYEGLYAYARASFGYAFYQPPFNSIDKGINAFVAQPAIGARLTLSERFHVGIEPFGLSILHTFPTKSTTQPEDTLVAFQIAILGGARF